MSVLGWFPFVTADRQEHSNAVADPGEGPGGRPPLIFRPNWGQKSREFFFETSLAHASIVADQVFHYDDRRNDRLNMKNKLVHFATHLLLLSSRLFAAALVTASYNTGLWVVFIFAFHYILILIKM